MISLLTGRKEKNRMEGAQGLCVAHGISFKHSQGYEREETGRFKKSEPFRMIIGGYTQLHINPPESYQTI